MTSDIHPFQFASKIILHSHDPHLILHIKGGLKAVVWTDVVQTISMLGALLLVAVKGTMAINGVSEIYDAAITTDRIELPK